MNIKWRWFWLHLQMPWNGHLSSVEIQTNVLLACHWHVMLYQKVYESVRSRKIRRKSRCAKCKDDKITIFWGRLCSSTRVTSKEMPRNSQKNLPIYGIPTFDSKLINAKTSPQIPIEPFAFFRENAPFNAPCFTTGNVAKVSSILPMTSFPLWVKIKVAGFTWIMMDGWWWINGCNARHPWEFHMAGTKKNSPSWKWASSEPKLHFWSSKCEFSRFSNTGATSYISINTLQISSRGPPRGNLNKPLMSAVKIWIRMAFVTGGSIDVRGVWF